MTQAPPGGITPPAPGLDREEPDLWREDDLPADDGGKPAARPAPAPATGPARSEDRPQRRVERE